MTSTSTIDAGFPLDAHRERYARDPHDHARADGRTVVELADDVVPADRDLELAWTPAVGAEPGAAVFAEDSRTAARTRS